MTDAQTKAQAIAPERIWIEQDDCPYFYPEAELSDVGSPVTGYVREDIFAAKDAELAEVWQQYVDANEARIDAEAQLAEARKALGMMLKEHDILSGNFGDDVMDPKHKRPDRWPTAAEAARRALETMKETDWVADKIPALKGGVSEPSAPSEWQKRGPDFNEWEIEWERFATMLADAKGEYFWVCDGALKYLNIRLDTRSNAFILRDRDDNRIDPSRVEAAIQQCRDMLGGVVKIDRDGRRELKENIHDKG